jgi:hypothetical protein
VDSPAVDGEPIELLYRVVPNQSRESVVDGKWAVSARETVSGRRTSGSDDTSGRSTDVNDRDSHPLVLRSLVVWVIQLSGSHVDAVILLELAVTEFHCSFGSHTRGAGSQMARAAVAWSP